MGLFKNLGNAFSGLSVGYGLEKSISAEKSDGGGTMSLTDIMRGTQTKGPYVNFSKEQQLRIITNNSIVFSCVRTLAMAFQEAPLIVETRSNVSDDTWVQHTTHKLLEPFHNNPDLTESEIHQYYINHLELCGQSFQWKWGSPDGVTRELWPVPPSWVTINLVDKLSADPSAARVIESFSIAASDGEEYTVLPEDMEYSRFIDPSNLYGGLSPVQAASRYIQLEQKAEVYKGEAISALSLPGVAVKTLKPMNRQQKEDLRAALRQKMGGDARQNAIMISGDQAKVELLNPLESFDWEAYSNLNETRICGVFGVPPIVIQLLVGLVNSPWSNTGDARRWMYRNTVKGLWDMAGVAHTRAYVPERERVAGLMRMVFKLDEVAELQEDINEAATRARELWNAGMATRNEARGMIKLPPIPGKDVLKYRMSDTLIQQGEDGLLSPEPEPIPLEDQLDGADNTDLV